VLSDRNTKRPEGEQQPALTCSKDNEEVAEIGKLLLTLAARSISPPERTATAYPLRLRPGPEVDATVRDFIRRDKECCPFLDFSVKREPQVLQVDVRGPDGASRLLDLCVEFVRLGERPS
jgi:hypothetical protein